MDTAIARLPGRRWWLNSVIWLAAFASPTMYVVLLILASRTESFSPPEGLVAALFILVPTVALIVCGWIAWTSTTSVGGRIGAILFTLVAMALQLGALFSVIYVTLVALTSYAQ